MSSMTFNEKRARDPVKIHGRIISDYLKVIDMGADIIITSVIILKAHPNIEIKT